MSNTHDKARKLVSDFYRSCAQGDYVLVEKIDGQYCLQIDSRFGGAPAPLLWVREYSEVLACVRALRRADVRVEWRKVVKRV